MGRTVKIIGVTARTRPQGAARPAARALMREAAVREEAREA